MPEVDVGDEEEDEEDAIAAIVVLLFSFELETTEIVLSR